uniref:Uncharacterized protein n=1 Tax=Oryza rufipogon TaxID=4529 RepID=A0A0E0RJM2_ORYRU
MQAQTGSMIFVYDICEVRQFQYSVIWVAIKKRNDSNQPKQRRRRRQRQLPLRWAPGGGEQGGGVSLLSVLADKEERWATQRRGDAAAADGGPPGQRPRHLADGDLDQDRDGDEHPHQAPARLTVLARPPPSSPCRFPNRRAASLSSPCRSFPSISSPPANLHAGEVGGARCHGVGCVVRPGHAGARRAAASGGGRRGAADDDVDSAVVPHLGVGLQRLPPAERGDAGVDVRRELLGDDGRHLPAPPTHLLLRGHHRRCIAGRRPPPPILLSRLAPSTSSPTRWPACPGENGEKRNG